MSFPTAFAAALLFFAVVILALTPVLRHENRGYNARIEACYFDEGCCLNSTEYAAFIRNQEKHIYEALQNGNYGGRSTETDPARPSKSSQLCGNDAPGYVVGDSLLDAVEEASAGGNR